MADGTLRSVCTLPRHGARTDRGDRENGGGRCEPDNGFCQNPSFRSYETKREAVILRMPYGKRVQHKGHGANKQLAASLTQTSGEEILMKEDEIDVIFHGGGGEWVMKFWGNQVAHIISIYLHVCLGKNNGKRLTK